MYRRADAVATVSQYDAAWVERRASAEDGDAAEAEGREGQVRWIALSPTTSSLTLTLTLTPTLTLTREIGGEIEIGSSW